MDFKTGKIIEIVRGFLANGEDKFEINGVDLSKAVFMYRERNTSFIPIPKGNYTTKLESNVLYLNIDDNIKVKAYEYQIIYTTDMKAGKYLEEYPELRVLVSKYNDLVEDVTNIVKFAKTSGAKIDSLKMTQVLTHLEPNTFWVMNSNEQLEAFPIGDLNSKYAEMVSTLKKEVEELIKTTKESSISDINTNANLKLNEFQNKLEDKLNELNALTENLKSALSNAVAKYIEENRERLKGDKGDGITSIEQTGETTLKISYGSKSTDVTVPGATSIKNLKYENPNLILELNDGTNKQTEIKSGIKLRQVFEGELGNNFQVSLGDKWKICFCEFLNGHNYEYATILKSGEIQNCTSGTADLTILIQIINNQFKYSSLRSKLKKIYVLEEVEIDKNRPGEISELPPT